jgi:hypothetical protein
MKTLQRYRKGLNCQRCGMLALLVPDSIFNPRVHKLGFVFAHIVTYYIYRTECCEISDFQFCT